MTEKENQNKNSDANFETTSLECFQRIKQNPFYFFLSLFRQLSILITISAYTESFVKFTGLQEK